MRPHAALALNLIQRGDRLKDTTGVCALGFGLIKLAAHICEATDLSNRFVLAGILVVDAIRVALQVTAEAFE